MTIQQELQIASFRGVTFFWRSSSMTGGRKTATHEFPNKDTRFTEDLGRLPKSFSIEATVSHLNYRQNRDSLINALDGLGSATLVHPTLGSFEVQVTTYTLNEDIGDLGNARFSIAFERTGTNIFPIQTQDNKSALTSKAQSLFSKIGSNIASGFQSVTGRFQSFNDAKDKVVDFANKAQDAANASRQVAANINEYSNDINNMIQDVNALIVAPAQLAASINNILVQGQNLFESASGVLNYYQSLFGYGDDDVIGALITADRIFRQNNRSVLNNNIQIGALSGAYQSVVNLEFATTEDIENIRDLLEEQYIKLIEQEPIDPDVFVENELIDFDTKELLQDLRNEVETFLEQQEQVTSNITQFRVHNEPITPLTYRLYGSLDNTQAIIDLNVIDNLSFIDKEIDVVTEQV